MSVLDDLGLGRADVAALASDRPERRRGDRGRALDELGLAERDLSALAVDRPERPRSARPSRRPRRAGRPAADPTLVAAVVARVREAEERREEEFVGAVIDGLGLRDAEQPATRELSGPPLSEAQAAADDWTGLPDGTRISAETFVSEGVALSDPGEILAD